MAHKWLRPVLAMLVCFAASCNGGGSSPTAAPMSMNVSGSWSGTVIVRSAAAVGVNIVPDAYRQTRNIAVNIDQSGSSLSASVVADLVSPTCRFTGFVNENRVSLQFASCTNDAPPPQRRLTAATFNGTVSGNQLTGALDEAFGTTMYEPEAVITTHTDVTLSR